MMTRIIDDLRQEALLILHERHGGAFFLLDKETQELLICETIIEAFERLRAED